MFGAIGLAFVMVGAALVHYEYVNWRVRRCDACRIEHGIKGRSTVMLAHTCSSKRFPYKREVTMKR